MLVVGITALCLRHVALLTFLLPTTLGGGLSGTGPPDPTLKSASPSPPQGSIWRRFNIDSTLIRHRSPDLTLFRCQIDVESMTNRPLRRGGRGGFEGAVRGACAFTKLPSHTPTQHTSVLVSCVLACSCRDYKLPLPSSLALSLRHFLKERGWGLHVWKLAVAGVHTPPSFMHPRPLKGCF